MGTLETITIGYYHWIFYWLSPKFRKTFKGEVMKRQLTCKRCEHLGIGICKKCGCILTIKLKGQYDKDENGICYRNMQVPGKDGLILRYYPCQEKKW